jgi:hypothetical protein
MVVVRSGAYEYINFWGNCKTQQTLNLLYYNILYVLLTIFINVKSWAKPRSILGYKALGDGSTAHRLHLLLPKLLFP